MWFNPIMLWILRSPFHTLLDSSTLAITYTGRKSGKRYTLPVNFVQCGEELLTVSLAKRTWWRSLRGGAQVSLLLRGEELPAHAEAFEEVNLVSQGLAEIVRSEPKWANYLKVKLDEQGQTSMVELDYAAQKRVLVRSKLTA
jgi:hypothetical protein